MKIKSKNRLFNEIQEDINKSKISSVGRKYSTITVFVIFLVVSFVIVGDWMIEKRRVISKEAGNSFYDVLYHDYSRGEREKLLSGVFKQHSTHYSDLAALKLFSSDDHENVKLDDLTKVLLSSPFRVVRSVAAYRVAMRSFIRDDEKYDDIVIPVGDINYFPYFQDEIKIWKAIHLDNYVEAEEIINSLIEKPDITYYFKMYLLDLLLIVKSA